MLITARPFHLVNALLDQLFLILIQMDMMNIAILLGHNLLLIKQINFLLNFLIYYLSYGGFFYLIKGANKNMGVDLKEI